MTSAGVGSVRGPNEYTVETTPLAPGARGANWRGYFNDQLTGPVVAFHDGDKITVYCGPDGDPDWLEQVDAAIDKANKEEDKLQSERGT